MPAYSTHCIFAREMIPFIYTAADFEINEEAVMLGTQGPDIFFFHRVLPWMVGKPLRAIGSRLHRAKPSLLLESMREYCNNISAHSDIAKSYAYGFIMHYALDRKCHPFVYSFQEKMVKQKPFTNPHTAHNLIELGMDTYLLAKRFGVSKPALFDTACTVGDSPEVLREIGKLYEYVIPHTLGIKIKHSDGELAIKDTKKIQEITRDTTGLKRLFVTIIECAAAPFSKNYKFSAMLRPRDLEKAKKYGNIENREWISPFDNSRHNESFEDLFELAKADAKEIISGFRDGCDLSEITHDLSFLTGVEVK